jgi:hypothetical protein
MGRSAQVPPVRVIVRVPRVLEAGSAVPEARVWMAPQESSPLTELLAGGAALVLFYLFDWSGT